MKKTVVSLFLVLAILLSMPVTLASAESVPVKLSNDVSSARVVRFDNGAILEISAPRAEENRVSSLNQQSSKLAATRSTNITRAIDAQYRNPNGIIEWKYTLHATFSYTYGVSSTCLSAWYTQNIYSGYASNWEFTDGAATRSGNRANGTGNYKQKLLFFVLRTFKINLHLICDKYGVVN